MDCCLSDTKWGISESIILGALLGLILLCNRLFSAVDFSSGFFSCPSKSRNYACGPPVLGFKKTNHLRMKKPALLSLFFLSFNVLLLSGQARLNHPAKMHQAENGKLYVNKHQPMYLYIGSTPTSTENMHRLESHKTPQYTNPFYFDTEGLNTIRTPSQVDTITKQVVYPVADIVFEVFADGLAPTTKVMWSNAVRYVNSGKVFYGKGLSVSMTATDQMSGVQNIYVSRNSQPYTAYTDTLHFEEESDYTIRVYAVDHVGNVEEDKTFEFSIDATPPVANWSLEGNVHGRAASGDSKIIIAAKDSRSGLKQIRYQINDQPVRIYKDGINLSALPTGEYALKYWAEDNVGNVFEGNDVGTSVIAFVVDRTPPTASSLVLGDQSVGKVLYVSPRSQIELSARDTVSGIHNIIYGYSQRFMDEIYEAPFALEDKHGLQTVWFQALDMVSNRSVIEKLTVFMDNEAPISRIEYDGPQFFTRDTLFISSETTVQLKSEDADSGVDQIEYRINGGSFQRGQKFKLPNGGFHTIDFKATDKVLNVEAEKQSELVVDNEAPEIYVNFSIKALREEELDGEKISVYPPYVKMYIGATDRFCGTQDIFYAIDGGEKRLYGGANSPSGNELFKDEKLYEVHVEATDKLGNSSLNAIKFRVAKK